MNHKHAVCGVIIILMLITIAVAHGALSNEGVIKSVPITEKVVALTYDDGPHPVFTPELLHVLEKYHVRATFFMIGSRMEQYPDIVKEVVSKGHVIGNHTYSHPSDIKTCTNAQVIQELNHCEEVIQRMTGKHAHLFRPPKGLIGGDVLTTANKEGYKTILWTVCADHHDAPTPQLMAERVLRAVRPGAIILAHDGRFPTRWKDVAATPLIIQALTRQGYRFVTVPELLAIQSREKIALQNKRHEK